MKKICFKIMLIFTLIMLCSCNYYIKSYSATILITSCYGDEASMKFNTFKGTYNFKLRRDDTAEHNIDCKASLVEGQMNIYISVSSEKELLFTINGGESLDKIITLDSKYDDAKKVYIIIESIGKCVNGDFNFEYN